MKKLLICALCALAACQSAKIIRKHGHANSFVDRFYKMLNEKCINSSSDTNDIVICCDPLMRQSDTDELLWVDTTWVFPVKVDTAAHGDSLKVAFGDSFQN